MERIGMFAGSLARQRNATGMTFHKQDKVAPLLLVDLV